VVREETHEDRGGVPSARNQATEGSLGGEPGIGVDRLGIEPSREGHDLVLGRYDVPVLVQRSRDVILEIAVVYPDQEVSGAQRAGDHIRHGSSITAQYFRQH
jgi:hypothetical protein